MRMGHEILKEEVDFIIEKPGCDYIMGLLSTVRTQDIDLQTAFNLAILNSTEEHHQNYANARDFLITNSDRLTVPLDDS